MPRKKVKSILAEEPTKKKIKLSHKFVSILSIVSILGFVGIVSYSLFDYDLTKVIEALWLIIVGLGLIFEARIRKLEKIKKTGLNPTNFTHLITVIIGSIAILSGLFSFPGINITTHAFIAVKGIIAIIAIIIIIIQTWVIE